MSLLNHTMNIITKPKQEWEVIKSEQTTVGSLFSGYICILALIPALASFIGMSIIGFSVLGFSFKIPIMWGAISAVASYILGLIGVYVAALVINALAKSFESTPDMLGALKLVAFSYTPMWLCGIFSLYSPISFLGILGLYGLYVMYLGLTPMMNTSPAKRVVYLVVSIIILIVIMFIISLIVGAITTAAVSNSMMNMMKFDIN
jgi:hypothetical protein